MPGEYVSVREDQRRAQALTISREPSGEGDRLGLSMQQAAVNGEDARRFGLKLEPGAMSNRLKGEIALLDPQGRARRSCAMAFQVSERGLVGETDPASCRFGDDEDSVGLLKEIAFDGSELTIGDRLVNPDSGEAVGEDRIIRFLPVRGYDGWLGVREDGQWRVARNFKLRTGESIEPLDAAEMSLGLSISLNYYRMERGGDETLMRLTVTRLEDGSVVAEAWSAPGSATIGVALPDLQVGLSGSN
jgi:hypothetical protein